MDKNKETNINITVPKGCVARTTVSPIKCLTDMNYSRVFSQELLELVRNKNLTLTDIRVLFYLIIVMNFENTACVSQAQIAKDINGVRQEVTKSIKKLIDECYIDITNQIGRQNVYLINPRLAFKSRAFNHSRLVEDWDEGQVIDKIQ